MSKYWEHLCGYKESDVVGLKPNFLQGKETNLEDLIHFEHQLSSEGFSETVVVNYTKQNFKFLNNLQAIKIDWLNNNETELNAVKYIAEVRKL